MSFNTTSAASNDRALIDRITACTSTEAWRNPALHDTEYGANVRLSPTAFITPMIWAVVTASDVIAAYEYALNADNPNPGGDEGVITDGMILGNVQASWPMDPAT